jgi:hypothetical protein
MLLYKMESLIYSFNALQGTAIYKIMWIKKLSLIWQFANNVYQWSKKHYHLSGHSADMKMWKTYWRCERGKKLKKNSLLSSKINGKCFCKYHAMEMYPILNWAPHH